MKKNDWRKVPTANWGHQREMRADPPPAERALWRAIRANQLGAHFRRQHTVGPYIVDFCAPREQLVIEVDGHTHGGDQAGAADQRRDGYLRSQGYRVLRFTNDEVLRTLDGVIAEIKRILELGSPPSLTGGIKGG
ncbi:endonuclease domain-containing protein [candidate division KSB1 bacterium]|nr:endonuclease domain-containing protein [candidate division KSB1 bacterium]